MSLAAQFAGKSLLCADQKSQFRRLCGLPLKDVERFALDGIADADASNFSTALHSQLKKQELHFPPRAEWGPPSQRVYIAVSTALSTAKEDLTKDPQTEAHRQCAEVFYAALRVDPFHHAFKSLLPAAFENDDVNATDAILSPVVELTFELRTMSSHIALALGLTLVITNVLNAAISLQCEARGERAKCLAEIEEICKELLPRLSQVDLSAEQKAFPPTFQEESPARAANRQVALVRAHGMQAIDAKFGKVARELDLAERKIAQFKSACKIEIDTAIQMGVENHDQLNHLHAELQVLQDNATAKAEVAYFQEQFAVFAAQFPQLKKENAKLSEMCQALTQQQRDYERDINRLKKDQAQLLQQYQALDHRQSQHARYRDVEDLYAKVDGVCQHLSNVESRQAATSEELKQKLEALNSATVDQLQQMVDSIREDQSYTQQEVAQLDVLLAQCFQEKAEQAAEGQSQQEEIRNLKRELAAFAKAKQQDQQAAALRAQAMKVAQATTAAGQELKQAVALSVARERSRQSTALSAAREASSPHAWTGPDPQHLHEYSPAPKHHIDSPPAGFPTAPTTASNRVPPPPPGASLFPPQPTVAQLQQQLFEKEREIEQLKSASAQRLLEPTTDPSLARDLRHVTVNIPSESPTPLERPSNTLSTIGRAASVTQYADDDLTIDKDTVKTLEGATSIIKHRDNQAVSIHRANSYLMTPEELIHAKRSGLFHKLGSMVSVVILQQSVLQQIANLSNAEVKKCFKGFFEVYKKHLNRRSIAPLFDALQARIWEHPNAAEVFKEFQLWWRDNHQTAICSFIFPSQLAGTAFADTFDDFPDPYAIQMAFMWMCVVEALPQGSGSAPLKRFYVAYWCAALAVPCKVPKPHTIAADETSRERTTSQFKENMDFLDRISWLHTNNSPVPNDFGLSIYAAPFTKKKTAKKDEKSDE